ncbi:MAG: type IV pilus twitching motility protein PilT [Candidatus Hydrogenedentota bacterium]|jgi:twitching motility protein PilT|uniref:Type IV pili twitching motility protein PilT n=1 Tax=Sumerlaea chitinivorans TaxID=2250252 RepID=A0A2Z4Y2Z4_SUMC1|nr:type IV pili twitching motility protein PilT [Candidatus Sumerlaea chitinivorans]RMH27347.1 MAG: type IV pilus twitching motility protein PilT [Candidatus Hydrogenedentota bacterium]GIX44602.1 MAG: twitching motility protein PilT [Candidatus Sumerlaea sp.]
MLEMNEMLKLVVERDASDLHISVGKPPVMRLHGTLDIVDPNIITPEDSDRLMREITPPRYQQMIQETGSADFAYAYSDLARFRCAVFRARGNISIVMRLIPSKILTFDQLGLPRDSIIEVLHAHRGLVLVTGPTGSGKTTTLATMIDYINSERYVHIITIEDPLEYIHPHKKAIVTHRELHVDTPSFAYALRGALRQDPDVILVGEMRDLETMEAAITAAETGHLVFATLHTVSASETVNRIIDAFPVNQQEQIRAVLSVALRTIIAQTLVPRASGKGRVAAYEILHNTPAVANLIREKKVNRIISTIQTSAKQGMITLDDYLLNLYKRGIITGEVALQRCHYPNEMREKMMALLSEQGSEGQPAA